MAFFFFAAPELAKRASANYDHQILEHFLREWRNSLTAFRPSDVPSAETFAPKVSGGQGVLHVFIFTFYHV